MRRIPVLMPSSPAEKFLDDFRAETWIHSEQHNQSLDSSCAEIEKLLQLIPIPNESAQAVHRIAEISKDQCVWEVLGQYVWYSAGTVSLVLNEFLSVVATMQGIRTSNRLTQHAADLLLLLESVAHNTFTFQFFINTDIPRILLTELQSAPRRRLPHDVIVALLSVFNCLLTRKISETHSMLIRNGILDVVNLIIEREGQDYGTLLVSLSILCNLSSCNELERMSTPTIDYVQPVCKGLDKALMHIREAPADDNAVLNLVICCMHSLAHDFKNVKIMYNLKQLKELVWNQNTVKNYLARGADREEQRYGVQETLGRLQRRVNTICTEHKNTQQQPPNKEIAIPSELEKFVNQILAEDKYEYEGNKQAGNEQNQQQTNGAEKTEDEILNLSRIEQPNSQQSQSANSDTNKDRPNQINQARKSALTREALLKRALLQQLQIQQQQMAEIRMKENQIISQNQVSASKPVALNAAIDNTDQSN